MTVEEMLAPAGLESIYDALKGSFQRTMEVKKVLEEGLYDSWRGNVMKERAVVEALYEVVHDEETARRIFKIVKEETDY